MEKGTGEPKQEGIKVKHTATVEMNIHRLELTRVWLGPDIQSQAIFTLGMIVDSREGLEDAVKLGSFLGIVNQF